MRLLEGGEESAGIVEFARARAGIEEEAALLEQHLAKAEARGDDDLADVVVLADDLGEEGVERLGLRGDDGGAHGERGIGGEPGEFFLERGDGAAGFQFPGDAERSLSSAVTVTADFGAKIHGKATRG